MPEVRVIPPVAERAHKLRVAAYARVSSDSADQLNSFASQVEYYTNYIQSKDEWEFAGLYADEAVTGTSAEKAQRLPAPYSRLPGRKNRPHSRQIHFPICPEHTGLHSNCERAKDAGRGDRI